MTCDYCGKSLSCADKPRNAPNGLPLFVCNKCYEQLKKSNVVDTKENKSKEINTMNKIEVRCPNCQTAFLVGNGGNAVTELTDGIHYLVPETIRNENVSPETKTKARFDALKAVGIDIDKLNNLMQKDDSFKGIFEEDDPILNEIKKGGFIRNPELFRRWITAQTFALLKDPHGWTYAVRKRYNTAYVYKQTRNELNLQIKLHRKGVMNDKRFTFFTLEDFKCIFFELLNENRYYCNDDYKKGEIRKEIIDATSLESLNNVVSRYFWSFRPKQSYMPRTWLNCFKGAGAYYTLQNIIRTHGMILPNCKDMNESLERVENVYKDILGYEPCCRRWDILLSVLTVAVKETNFELKY